MGRKVKGLTVQDVRGNKNRTYSEMAVILECSITAVRNFMIKNRIRKQDCRVKRKGTYCY